MHVNRIQGVSPDGACRKENPTDVQLCRMKRAEQSQPFPFKISLSAFVRGCAILQSGRYIRHDPSGWRQAVPRAVSGRPSM